MQSYTEQQNGRQHHFAADTKGSTKNNYYYTNECSNIPIISLRFSKTDALTACEHSDGRTTLAIQDRDLEQEVIPGDNRPLLSGINIGSDSWKRARIAAQRQSLTCRCAAMRIHFRPREGHLGRMQSHDLPRLVGSDACVISGAINYPYMRTRLVEDHALRISMAGISFSRLKALIFSCLLSFTSLSLSLSLSLSPLI
jgi:hypothetical protein